ncbi:MAG: hypothetical protein ACRDUY_13565 [Nitriliruptorales bacterium]
MRKRTAPCHFSTGAKPVLVAIALAVAVAAGRGRDRRGAVRTLADTGR